MVEFVPADGTNEHVDKQLKTRQHVQSRVFVAARDFGIARRRVQQGYQQDERLVPIHFEHQEAVALQRGVAVTVLQAVLSEGPEATPFGSGHSRDEDDGARALKAADRCFFYIELYIYSTGEPAF